MTSEPNDPAILALYVDRLMRRIHADLHPKAGRVDVANIGPLGGMILMTIEEEAPISLQDLSKKIMRDKGQMTRLIQSFERKNLITRTQNDADGRMSFLNLSPEGQRLVSAFRKELADVVGTIFKEIDIEEKDKFIETLRKITRASGD